jgi:SAM-dependent methyltransferase
VSESVRYDRIGAGYRRFRLPDHRIAARLREALGDARSVLNVGAGTGSYEPDDLQVTAVEPSAVMIAQRPPTAAPVVQASAESLPFDDASVDACMGVLTIHHWHDIERGLTELRRVARRRVVLLTWVAEHEPFWLRRDYFPEFDELDRAIFPPLERLERCLGRLSVETVLVPHDCTDGFLGAYWRRPEAYLDPDVRAAISSFSMTSNIEPRIERLRADLASGAWRERNGSLLDRASMDLGYRLVRWERGSMIGA